MLFITWAGRFLRSLNYLVFFIYFTVFNKYSSCIHIAFRIRVTVQNIGFKKYIYLTQQFRYLMVKDVGFVISKEDLALGPCLITQELLCSSFIKVKKGTEKASDIDIRRGMEKAPTHQSYQGLIYFSETHSHNIHFKMTGLVRRFSRRRNKSSSRTHCCYIIIGTEFKEKHILEQDELFCCAVISSGLKEKKHLSFSPP